ncbi:MAG TPA: ATP-binding protein [Polyangia bacterium]|nr:ATP-binding protein [Polyangia bacterium]
MEISPTTIAREVVAFLNAKGGDILVGVGEQDGVATSLQSIPHAAAASGTLLNHLIDTIEPSPLDDEVKIDRIANDDLGDIIRIHVRAGSRRPYALLKDRERQFHVRVADRIREMTRQEIAEAFGGTPSLGDRVAEAMKRVGEAADGQSGAAQFWWCLEPTESLGIDFENADTETKKFFEDLVMRPHASGNRSSGWTMIFDQVKPRFRSSGLRHAVGTGANEYSVEISSNGRMTCQAPLGRLYRGGADEALAIYPFALIELPVSTYRMAARMLDRYATSKTELKIVAAAVIGGIAGSTLQPGSPNEPSRSWHRAKPFEGKDLRVPPFSVEAGEIRKTPDAAAYPLIRRIYEGFDLDGDDIPREFGPEDHVLRLPRT